MTEIIGALLVLAGALFLFLAALGLIAHARCLQPYAGGYKSDHSGQHADFHRFQPLQPRTMAEVSAPDSLHLSDKPSLVPCSGPGGPLQRNPGASGKVRITGNPAGRPPRGRRTRTRRCPMIHAVLIVFSLMMLASALAAGTAQGRDRIDNRCGGCFPPGQCAVPDLRLPPDVAMTEAAIGSALTTVVFLIVWVRIKGGGS